MWTTDLSSICRECETLVVHYYDCTLCPSSPSGPSVVVGNSHGSTIGGLTRLRGAGLFGFSAFDPPSSAVLGTSSRAWATFRGRPLGRFGGSCVETSLTCVIPSSGSEVVGCLPFPLPGARFLGAGRVRSGGSSCSSPSSSGCLEERSPSAFVVAFAFPFLRVSYLALHWTTQVNIRGGWVERANCSPHYPFFCFPSSR